MMESLFCFLKASRYQLGVVSTLDTSWPKIGGLFGVDNWVYLGFLFSDKIYSISAFLVGNLERISQL